MNKIKFLILTLLLPFLLINPANLKADSFNDKKVQIETRQLDKRAQTLRDYLAQYDSPLQYHAQDFIDAADTYNVDWKLVPAISGVESTFGKNIPGGYEQSSTSYNGWGWGVYGNQALYFDSWREGIFTVTQGLRENYINKGYNDPYSMNRVYAASPYWGFKVSYFLKNMQEFERNHQNKLSDQAVEPNNLESKTAGTSARLAFRI